MTYETAINIICQTIVDETRPLMKHANFCVMYFVLYLFCSKTKLCSLPLNFVELPNQLVLSTLLKLSNLHTRAVWTSITICDIITVLDVSFLNYQKWKQQVEVGEQLKLGKFILKGLFHGSAHAPVFRNLVCVPARNKATF